MATPTYTLIDSVTLGSASSTVSFTSIPAGGDLVIVIAGSLTASNRNVRFTINGTTSGYSWVAVHGDGSSAYSDYAESQAYMDYGYVRETFLATISLFDFSATNKHKSMLSRSGSDEDTSAYAGKWANTAAITSLSFFANAASYSAGTTFHLYNIAKAL